jgi:hypothetical protein
MDVGLRSARSNKVEVLDERGQVDSQPQGRAGLMTMSQLRDVAQRKGLDFEMLLESAKAKGLDIRD